MVPSNSGVFCSHHHIPNSGLSFWKGKFVSRRNGGTGDDSMLTIPTNDTYWDGWSMRGRVRHALACPLPSSSLEHSDRTALTLVLAQYPSCPSELTNPLLSAYYTPSSTDSDIFTHLTMPLLFNY